MIAAVALLSLGIPARGASATDSSLRAGAQVAELAPPPRTSTWPVTIHVHAMIGTEPHGSRGNPVAFGAGGELLWRGRVGGFAALLSSAGTPILPNARPGLTTEPSLADRISVPFGLVARPFAVLVEGRGDYLARLAAGVGVQVGVTVEHLRLSLESATRVGFHGAAFVDVPIFGGPREGGLALRVYGRLLATEDAPLNQDQLQKVYEPAVSGQIFGGLSYTP